MIKIVDHSLDFLCVYLLLDESSYYYSYYIIITVIIIIADLILHIAYACPNKTICGVSIKSDLNSRVKH